MVARLLTPHEMGIFGLSVAAYYLISSLRDFGVGSYLIQQATLNDEKIRSAFGVWIVVSWSLAFLVFALRNYIANFYHTAGIANVLALITVSLIVTPVGQPAQALLSREMRFDVLHHIALAATAVTVVTNIGLAVVGFSYMALAWGMVAGTVINSCLLILVRPTHLRMLPSLKHWRDVLGFGGWLTGVSLIDTIKVEGNRFILGAYINPAAVGLFDRAIQIPNQVRDSLFSPLWRVLFPAFSRDIRDGISISPSLEKLVAITSVVVWPAFLTIGVLAQPILVVLFGEKWRVAGEILPFFLFSQALLALLPPAYQILVPHGKVRRYFWLSTFGALNVLSFAVVGAMHSLRMFAMLNPVAVALYLVVACFSIRKFLGVSWRSFVRHYRNSCVVAVLSSSPALICYLLYGQNVPVLALAGVALISPVLWLLLLYAVKNPAIGEISQVVSRLANISGSSASRLVSWMSRM